MVLPRPRGLPGLSGLFDSLSLFGGLRTDPQGDKERSGAKYHATYFFSKPVVISFGAGAIKIHRDWQALLMI